MSPRIGLTALLLTALCAAYGVPSAAAASISRVTIEVGQGKSRFAGHPKYRARGFISFVTSDRGVACEDSIVLQRLIRESVDNRFRYRWIDIGEGSQRERTCRDRPGTSGPVRQRSAVSLFHEARPYLRLVQGSRLRVRYRVRVSFAGRLVFARTVYRPVTAATINQPYRSAEV